MLPTIKPGGIKVPESKPDLHKIFDLASIQSQEDYILLHTANNSRCFDTCYVTDDSLKQEILFDLNVYGFCSMLNHESEVCRIRQNTQTNCVSLSICHNLTEEISGLPIRQKQIRKAQ